MPEALADWTADSVRGLPDDGQRYEVIDGALYVTPAPAWTHQRAVGWLYITVSAWLSAHPVAEAVFSPADVELDPRTLVQPDLFVVPLVDGRRMRSWREIQGRLLLAIEVLSPSTARADRHVKRRRYQHAGVGEYWIVDLDARLVERWRPEDERPEILDARLAWQPDPEVPPLEFDLTALFAAACDG